MIEQATSVPVDPTDSGSESSTLQSIEGRIAQTDAHIIDWRTESVRRREAWDRAQAEALAEAAERRRRLWVPLLAVSAAAGMALTLAVALWALWPTAPRIAEVAEVAPPPVAVAEVAPPPPPAAVEEAPVVPQPVERVEPPAAVPVVAGSVELWKDSAHHWVRFEVDTEQPTWMEWRDAAGQRVLESMPCAAAGPEGHFCRAGRSHPRIRTALRAGAEPGDWTIEACSADGCSTVTTVAIP